MAAKMKPEDVRVHKGISFVGVTTSFLCHDGNGSFVIAKRSKNCRDEQGCWDIGAGGLEWGQKAEQSVTREIKEEYCADVQELTFLGYMDAFRELSDGTKTHWLILNFVALVDRKQVKIGEPEKADELGWFQLTNLPAPLHSQLRPFLQKYEAKLKQILDPLQNVDSTSRN